MLGGRHGRLRPSSVGVATLFMIGAPGLAHAQGALEPVDMSYRAPDGCPSLSQFLGEVQRSTQRLKLATAAEAARHFDVVVEAKQGRLTVDGGSNGVREVKGADCAEVSRLLAFAAALAADPDAQEPDETSSVAAFPAPPSMPPLPAPTPMPTAVLRRAPATTRAQAASDRQSPVEHRRFRFRQERQRAGADARRRSVRSARAELARACTQHSPGRRLRRQARSLARAASRGSRTICWRSSCAPTPCSAVASSCCPA